MNNVFFKSHGLGNDYIIIDHSYNKFLVDKKVIRLLCDRHFGIGSDGILLLFPSSEADFGLRIFNPDGSEAEKSGNGLRIFAKFLYDHGHTTKSSFSIETKGGLVRAHVFTDGNCVSTVTVDMGCCTFEPDKIPVLNDTEVVNKEISINGESLFITSLSVGNPHCVFFAQELNEEKIKKIGPLLENHPIFPKKTNVQMVKVHDRHNISILIWERGAGLTLASGSSSCAAACASYRNSCIDTNVTVNMPGGQLSITIDDGWNIQMSGSVEEIYEGKLSKEFIRKLERL